MKIAQNHYIESLYICHNDTRLQQISGAYIVLSTMSVGYFLLSNHVIGCTNNRLSYEVVAVHAIIKDGGHAVMFWMAWFFNCQLLFSLHKLFSFLTTNSDKRFLSIISRISMTLP